MADLTNEQAEALGRRWIAAGGWWLAGMLNGAGKFARVLVTSGDPDDPEFCAAEEGATEDDCYAVWVGYPGCWPDLRDPATLGACLAVVRERWGEPRAHLWPAEDADGGTPWLFRLCYGAAPRCEGNTEAEALVAALEAAPKGVPRG